MRAVVKKEASWAIILVCGGVILYLGIWKIALEDRVLNKSSKEALRRMHEEIRLGASQDDVLGIYERLKASRTTIQRDSLRDTWAIGMPFELGASDWILYVQFDGHSTVSCIAMRTSDGAHFKPGILPNDKGGFIPLQTK